MDGGESYAVLRRKTYQRPFREVEAADIDKIEIFFQENRKRHRYRGRREASNKKSVAIINALTLFADFSLFFYLAPPRHTRTRFQNVKTTIKINEHKVRLAGVEFSHVPSETIPPERAKPIPIDCAAVVLVTH